MQRLGEQVVQQREPIDVLDDAADHELKLIDAFGEPPPEQAFAAADLEGDFRLGSDQLADARVIKQPAKLAFMSATDDERLIKLRVANIDVLQPEHLRQAAEEVL